MKCKPTDDIIIGIDFASGDDKSVACIFNKKTRKFLRFEEIREKTTTPKQREKIMGKLIMKYKPQNIFC
jgi:hypothetical protein